MKKLLALVSILMMLFTLSACSVESEQTLEGEYQIGVTLSGGSGRTTIASPAKLVLEDDQSLATIEWSSPNYDYMLVDGIKYLPVNTEGNSTFEIPVTLDVNMEVVADTTAMSQPREIDYTLYFNSSTLEAPNESGQVDQSTTESMDLKTAIENNLKGGFNRTLGNGWMPESSMKIDYAVGFKVDYFKEGLTLISLSDGSRYLKVPEGSEPPEGIDEDIVILKSPIDNIYLVATSAMCLFDGLDALDQIRLSGTKAEGWYIEDAKARMESGQILYAGKYNAPDYELIMANQCQLAIESTMINHNPEVKEKLEEVGIPVLVDQASYETHPLGRTEWLKLYGVLAGKEALAESLFKDQVHYMENASSENNTGKTVAYFYINSSGNAVTRRSGDYVSKMIELAGGKYIFDDLGDSETATSTVTLEMEHFFASAKDADYIIYNSTVGGEVYSMEELLAKNSLLKDFKAVKEGNVWCTSQNLYQETTELGQAISDIHQMLMGKEEAITEGHFIYQLH